MRGRIWSGVVAIGLLALLPVRCAAGAVGDPPRFYAGADYAFLTFAVNRSPPGGLAERDYDARMVDLRAGYRFYPHIGLELHYGVPASGGSRPDEVAVRHRYGVFIAPNGVLFQRLEVAVPIGYAWGRVQQSLPGQAPQSTSINGAAVGLDLALPLRTLLAQGPDLRLLAGASVTVQRSDSELYGFHFGLRYDF